MFHQKCQRMIYNDKQSSFTELLNKDGSASIHIRNIQRLAIEMLKFYNGLSPSLMNNIFKSKVENLYNLKHVSEFSRPMVKSVYHETESISYLGPEIWDMLPEKLKNIENLEHEAINSANSFMPKENIDKFSNRKRLLNVTAIALRFFNNLKKRLNREEKVEHRYGTTGEYRPEHL